MEFSFIFPLDDMEVFSLRIFWYLEERYECVLRCREMMDLVSDRRSVTRHDKVFVVGWWVEFYGISTLVGYLTPNPFLCK